jgi:hypothetical protein
MTTNEAAAAWMDTLERRQSALEAVGRPSGCPSKWVLIELAGIR